MCSRPVLKNALFGFRSAHSVFQYLRLIVLIGENFRSIGPLKVPDLAALVRVMVVNSQAVQGLQLAVVRIFWTLLFLYC